MPTKSPFDIDEGIENAPVVKVPVQKAAQVGTSAVKHTKQQAAAMAKAFVGQLYGTSNSQAGDNDEQQPPAQANTAPASQAKQAISTPVYFHPTMQKGNTSSQTAGAGSITPKTPEEQEKLAEARKVLYHHKQHYYDPTLGRINDLEEDVREKRRRREQEEKAKKQEEEKQEEEKKRQEEEKKRKQLAVPKGKDSRARMGMPVALKRAMTKTEINRGATG